MSLPHTHIVPATVLRRIPVARLLASLGAAWIAIHANPSAAPNEYAVWPVTVASPLDEYADPTEAGFSAVVLEEARALADTSRSGALMAMHRGRVVAAWGAVDRPFMSHSIRKSLAGALYGQAVAAGTLSLSASLADLGIDDVPALTPSERGARVQDLVASRSGVYHGAAYAEGSGLPARGSHKPGTFWLYNNWDFNALETIYERATKLDFYQAFQRNLAEPLGMEDFSPAAQLRVLEPSLSRHPAHTVRVSARDLARFGQLYLQDGRWGAAEVVPRDWVRESLRVHSDAGNGVGYGYLWWIYSKAALGADRYPALAGREVILARGTGGHALFLIPSAEMVVVHRADTDNGRSVQGRAIWKMVDLLVGARKGTASPNPRLRPMQSVPLASQAPARPSPALVGLDAAALTPLVGDYAVPKGGAIRVFLHDGRLFANLPDHGEAELFATSATTFVALVVPGTGGEFAVGADGRAVRLRVTIGGQVIEARRR